MTRRKREITGLSNERDFPHLVELTFPPGGFRSVFLENPAQGVEATRPSRLSRRRHGPMCVQMFRRLRRARLCWSVKRSAFMGAAVLNSKCPSNSIVCAPSHVRRPNR
jgi:hypothetical protein